MNGSLAKKNSISLWGACLLLCLVIPGLLRAEPLALEQALELAFDRSPTMLQARHSLEISRRNLKAQRAALKSRFSLTLTPYQFSKDRIFNDLVSQYNTQEQTRLGATFSIQQPIERTDGTLSVVETFGWREAASSFASSFTGSTQDQTYNNSLFLRYSHPLFTYNRTRLQLKELELALENARFNHAIQKLQIENQVTRLFYDLYYKRESVRIAAEELENASTSFTIIEGKVRAGIAAEEELFQADLERASRRASLDNTQLQYANALDDFKIQLGQPLDAELEVIADVRKQLVEVDLEKAMAHGLRQRMELRQWAIAVQNAEADLVRTDAQNEFKGSVDLTYGLIDTEKDLTDLYGSSTRNQGVAVQFNVPLFDWGEKEHRLAAARQRVASQRQSAADQKNQIVLEIRRAYRSLQNQETRIEIAEKNVRNARRTYEINLERYRNGDLSSKDIGFYQNQLALEQLNEIGALIDYQLALLDLKVRSLYDFARDEPVAVLDAED